MKKFNLEINQDEINIMRLAVAAALKEFRNTRTQYTNAELLAIVEDENFEPFAKQKKELIDLNKRLVDLMDS